MQIVLLHNRRAFARNADRDCLTRECNHIKIDMLFLMCFQL
jgi:hypothetical protein